MTMTQANELGFVLANKAKPDPRIAPLAKALEAKRAELIAQPLSFIWNDLAKVAVDLAPLVPSPAYGGVRALEWGDSKSHGGRCLVGRDANGAEIARVYYDANREAVTSSRIVAKQAAAQSDFERRVLSCLSPVAVEEADAKAAALYGPYGWIVKPIGLGEDEWELEADPEEDTVNFVSVPLYTREPQVLGITAPATPSPQIGKAGAGPVGEPVVFEFDRYIDGTLMAEGVKIERQSTLGKASRRAAQIASRGPNGETPVLVLRSTFYARTVEEPGEVERLTRERDERWKQADTAEAALAETRERLEKVEAERDSWEEQYHAAANTAATYADFWDQHHAYPDKARLDWLEANSSVQIQYEGFEGDVWRAYRVNGGRSDREWNEIAEGGSLRDVLDIARAALTGDAQEAGR